MLSSAENEGTRSRSFIWHSRSKAGWRGSSPIGRSPEARRSKGRRGLSGGRKPLPAGCGSGRGGRALGGGARTRPQVAAETRRAYRLIRRVAPDVVHAHSAKAGLAARLALRGRVPTVYQPHAWSFEAVEGRTAGLARAWERWAARWTDRVLCVSEAERRTGERAGVAAPGLSCTTAWT